jgi:predicted lipoprotein with Yx(FWY)xxD motif
LAQNFLKEHIMTNGTHQSRLVPRIYALIAVALLAFLTGCASVSSVMPAQMKDGMLVNAKGMTLYTFDNDKTGTGKSVCNGPCAVKWPPMMAQADDKPVGDFAVITRDDGQKQWAHKGKPLYTWPEDQEPGDKFGDGYLKVWHIIQ